MRPEDYLKRASAQQRRVNVLYERIANIEAHVQSCTRIYGIVPRSDSPNPDQRYDAVAKLMDKKRELQQEIDQMVEIACEVEDVISNVKNDRLRTLLEYRYLACCTWERIAERMGYTTRNIYNMHNQALRAVEPFIPREE